jgi:hypothetical protein
MTEHTKRLALMGLALAALAVALAGCQSPSSQLALPAGNGGGVSTFHTPVQNLGTPTPTFPAFTMGAWPSNYSPANNDTITIYVLCRVQDPTKPPAQSLSITLVLNGPISGTYTGNTDADGMAAIPVTINDPYSGQPVTVVASTTYQGQSYTAATFFTPAPTAIPSPSPGTVTPGTTPSTGP